MSDSSVSRGFVVVDDRDPRDPAARCDGCGVRGTIARAVRHTEPPIVTRYCGACWPAAQGEFESQQAAEREQHREAFRRWATAFHRNPATAPPADPPAFSSASRSWHDTRRYLQRVAPVAGPRARAEDLARAAKDIRGRAPDMDGPMPPDIAAFVDEYDPPAA